jgi:hypothetical protein
MHTRPSPILRPVLFLRLIQRMDTSDEADEEEESVPEDVDHLVRVIRQANPGCPHVAELAEQFDDLSDPHQFAALLCELIVTSPRIELYMSLLLGIRTLDALDLSGHIDSLFVRSLVGHFPQLPADSQTSCLQLIEVALYRGAAAETATHRLVFDFLARVLEGASPNWDLYFVEVSMLCLIPLIGPESDNARPVSLIRFLFWKFDPISTRLITVIGHYLAKGADVALFTPEIVARLFQLMTQNRGILPILHTLRTAIEHNGDDARILVQAGIIQQIIGWHARLTSSSLQRMCQSLLRAICQHSGLSMVAIFGQGVHEFLVQEAIAGSFHRKAQAMMTWVTMLARATPDEIDAMIDNLFVEQVIELIDSLANIELRQFLRDLIKILRRANPEHQLCNALNGAGISDVLASMIEAGHPDETTSLLVELDEATKPK